MIVRNCLLKYFMKYKSILQKKENAEHRVKICSAFAGVDREELLPATIDKQLRICIPGK